MLLILSQSANFWLVVTVVAALAIPLVLLVMARFFLRWLRAVGNSSGGDGSERAAGDEGPS